MFISKCIWVYKEPIIYKVHLTVTTYTKPQIFPKFPLNMLQNNKNILSTKSNDCYNLIVSSSLHNIALLARFLFPLGQLIQIWVSRLQNMSTCSLHLKNPDVKYVTHMFLKCQYRQENSRAFKYSLLFHTQLLFYTGLLVLYIYILHRYIILLSAHVSAFKEIYSTDITKTITFWSRQNPESICHLINLWAITGQK